MRRQFLRFWADDAGTTAVEYSVMLAMILIVIIGAITTFGGAGNFMFGNIDNKMQAHGIH